VGISLHQSGHQGCYQLITIIKPSQTAQQRILHQIHLGLKDKVLFYRPIHSVQTEIYSRRRHECPQDMHCPPQYRYWHLRLTNPNNFQLYKTQKQCKRVKSRTKHLSRTDGQGPVLEAQPFRFY
jgi:hypothetical protein